MDRRTALKWMLAAAASTALAPRYARAQGATPATQGYGTDPDLLKHYKPGDVWPLTFTDAQRRTVAALSDIIIPADAGSPAASEVGIVDFLDEWISAPYPDQVADREVILPGLTWLDEEAGRRFSHAFAALDEAQKTAICDDICHTAKAKPELRPAARFFSKYRDLTAGGFYTTPQGRQDIRYVGNMPLATFDGPPPEVLRQAGLL
jgi:hypothetical protein